MQKTKTRLLRGLASILARPIRAVVSVKLRETRKPEVDVRLIRTAATVSVTLLTLAAVVKVTPAPHPHQVKVTLCQTVSDWTGAYLSNFITVDGEYFLLADGSLLFVKEESDG